MRSPSVNRESSASRDLNKSMKYWQSIRDCLNAIRRVGTCLVKRPTRYGGRRSGTDNCSWETSPSPPSMTTSPYYIFLTSHRASIPSRARHTIDYIGGQNTYGHFRLTRFTSRERPITFAISCRAADALVRERGGRPRNRQHPPKI